MGGPFPSYRTEDGPRGKRAHLRPTTRKPNMIIKIIKDLQRGEVEVKEGPLKHARADKVQNEERR